MNHNILMFGTGVLLSLLLTQTTINNSETKNEYNDDKKPSSIPLPSPSVKSKKVIKVLSIDGGGSKGLFDMEILRRLEKKIGKHIHKAFDIVCGTSIGGIISLLLTHPIKALSNKPISLDELIDMKLDGKRNIFELMNAAYYGSTNPKDKIPRYESKRIKPFWDSLFPDGNFGDCFDDTEVMVLAYELSKSKIKIFDSKKDKDYPTSIVAMATSADPLNFDFVKYNDEVFIDGSIISIDPSYIMLKDIKQRYPDHDILLVSVGTTNTGNTDFVKMGSEGWQSYDDLLNVFYEASLRNSRYIHGFDNVTVKRVKGNIEGIAVHSNQDNVDYNRFTLNSSMCDSRSFEDYANTAEAFFDETSEIASIISSLIPKL